VDRIDGALDRGRRRGLQLEPGGSGVARCLFLARPGDPLDGLVADG
jgi:hypothetical protein